jgi:hypothetical protein
LGVTVEIVGTLVKRDKVVELPDFPFKLASKGAAAENAVFTQVI